MAESPHLLYQAKPPQENGAVMRVLQVVQTPQRRGAEIFAYDLSQELEQQGLQTKIVYLYNYSGNESLPLRTMDVCLNGVMDHVLERFLGVQPQLLQKLRQEIRGFAPDIVQLNGARSVKYGAMVKLLSFRPPSWKLVYRTINIPSHWQKSRRILTLYKLVVMPQMDGVISVCTPGLQDANQLYDLDVPATVVLNGFDPARLSVESNAREDIRVQYGIEKDDIVVLFLGSLVPQKRPDRFVRLMACLNRYSPRCYGWIVGDGFLRNEVETQVSELGIADRVSLFGYQKDVGKFLAAADVYVLSSDTEGLPATVLEAGYLGLPVVSTDVGGVQEGIVHGVTGMLVPRDDEEALCSVTASLAGDGLARAKMAEASRQRYEREFAISRIADQYMEFYNSIFTCSSR